MERRRVGWPLADVGLTLVAVASGVAWVLVLPRLVDPPPDVEPPAVLAAGLSWYLVAVPVTMSAAVGGGAAGRLVVRRVGEWPSRLLGLVGAQVGAVAIGWPLAQAMLG